jgi:5-methylcytosine-specific restriction endonuclease McrA
LLNSDFTPLKVITWERAITLLFDEHADLVEHYVDRFVRSVSTATPWPAVLRLRRFVSKRPRMRFTRLNVLARDEYTCQYCGAKPVRKNGAPKLEELTIDHVIPRAQSRNGRVKRWRSGEDISVTCWEQVVCCCETCNLRKADRTPEQSGMIPRQGPRTPSPIDVLRMSLRKVTIPSEWKLYLPAGAEEWGGYWDGELAED